MFDNLNQNNNSQNNNEKGNEKPKDLNYSLNASREQTARPSEIAVDNGSKGKIEDIFSETDKTKPFIEVKKETGPQSDDEIEENKKKDRIIKILVLIGFTIGLFVILGGSYLLMGKLFDNNKINSANNINKIIPDNNEIENNIQEVNDNTIETIDPVESPVINNEKIDDGIIKEDEVINIEEVIIDTDGDGLSDEEEIRLGLDINNVDSDNDGLFDKEEIMVYFTDPLNPDTDGDGFSDGDEVKNGYNPNGPGKLYDINNKN